MIDVALSAAAGLLKGVPPLAWKIAAGAALLVAAVLWHGHAAKSAYNAAFNTGFSAATKKFNDAQAAADVAAQKRVVVIVDEQDAISKGSSDALVHSHADIDARAAELQRLHEAAARDRAIRPVDPGTASQAPGESCPAPPGDGLAWDVALPLMAQAAKNDAQLNAILDWEAKQDALDAAELEK